MYKSKAPVDNGLVQRYRRYSKRLRGEPAEKKSDDSVPSILCGRTAHLS
jgi:hypothetical protein